MTLHEAIEKLLNQKGKAMTTSEISTELNKNKWYQKKDASEITPYQIHGRTKNYPNLFDKNGALVSLTGKMTNREAPKKEVISKKEIVPKVKLIKTVSDISLREEMLMNENNFRSAAIIDSLVPNKSGLYCLRIKEIKNLPKPFDSLILDRNHNIIFIGIASQSLSKRFLNQELRAYGHGTFFRSIGAVLGFKPTQGSLINKKNKRNYTFRAEDEKKIISWINSNLLVNWIEFEGDFESFESEIISRHLPLLNLAKNPKALKHLSELRAECVRIANM